MKKKLLPIIMSVILLVGILTFGVIAANAETDTFAIKAASLSLENDVRVNFKVALPDGVSASDVKMLVWEGIPSDTDYDKDTPGAVTLTTSGTDQNNGYEVFQYIGIAAKEMGKPIYARAYYEGEDGTVYTEPVRYSVVQYLDTKIKELNPSGFFWEVEELSESERALLWLLRSIRNYGADAQAYWSAMGEDTGVSLYNDLYTVSVEDGTFADGFTKGTYLHGETVTLTSASFVEGEYVWVDSDNIFNTDGTEIEVTHNTTYKLAKLVDCPIVASVNVGGTDTEYRSLQQAIDHANGGTVKLLEDIALGANGLSLSGTEEAPLTITLDLNGKDLTSSAYYQFFISKNVTLTVKDSVGGGSISTTGDNVFYCNRETSELYIEGGTFESSSDVVYVEAGTATISGGTFTSVNAAAVYVEAGTATISGGTFSSDPSAYVDTTDCYIADNGDGTYTVKLFDGVIDTYEELKVALNKGGEVKLGANIDLEDNYFALSGTEEAPLSITLDLNGKELTSSYDYPFDIYDYATLTVKDSVGGGSITTTGDNVFYCNRETSKLCIEGGTFESSSDVVYVTAGEATISSGTFTSGGGSSAISAGADATLTVTGGTFSSDPSAYVDTTAYTVTENGDGTYTVAEKIDTYEELQAALENGGEVTLGANIDLGENGFTLDGTEDAPLSITLDLNGKELTSSAYYQFFISKNVTLTVKDSVGGGSITTTNGYVFRCYNTTSELYIEGGTFTSAFDAVYVDAGTVAISGGTFTSAFRAVYVFDGAATISGGTFTGGEGYDAIGAGAAATLTVTGGTFSTDPSAYVDIDYVATKNDDGTYTVTPFDGVIDTYEELKAALKNGGEVTLGANIDLGENHFTLDGTEEAPLSITLDLNGKELTSSDDSPFYIYDYATLTVKDSVGGGSITTTGYFVFYCETATSVLYIEGGSFTSADRAVYVFDGTATISGGTFSSNPSEYVDTTAYTVTENGDGTYTVTEGASAGGGNGGGDGDDGDVIDTYEEFKAALENGGEVTLGANIDLGENCFNLSGTENDPLSITLDLNGKELTSSYDYPFVIYENVKLTVKDSVGDGSVTTTGVNVFYCNEATSELYIEGGTFESSSTVVYVATGTATISGGTFTGGENRVAIYANEDATLTVTGGTFSSDPSDYVDTDNYTVTKNDDGTYTVTEGASAGGDNGDDVIDTYEELQAALENGGEVTLDANIDLGANYFYLEGTEDAPLSITLDLNGKELTSSHDYPFDIYENVKLTVKDSVGGGSITTTGGNVFYCETATSVLYIEGGSFTSADCAVYVFDGTATISGGTFTGGESHDAIYANEGATVTVTGGTFSSDPSYFVDTDNYTVTNNGDGTYTVAILIDTYEELQAALENGGEVTLGADIDLGDNYFELSGTEDAPLLITLDLNGKDLTSSHDYPFDIYDYATLTVKDSVGGGSIITTGSYVFYCNTETLELYIEGGTFESSSNVVAVVAGTATISGGTFSSDPSKYVDTDSYYIADNGDGTYTVTPFDGVIDTYEELQAALENGGEVTLGANIDLGANLFELRGTEEAPLTITLDLNGKELTSSCEYLFYIYDYATLTVKDSVGGGSITTTGFSVFRCYNTTSELYIEGGTFESSLNLVYVDAGTVAISGGTFTSAFRAVYVAAGEATISGGAFTGGKGYDAIVADADATLTVTGGTFSSNPSGYVDTTAYTVTNNGDGTYTVTENGAE